MQTLTVSCIDVGYDIRQHRTPVQLPTSGVVAVRCHPLGETDRVETVRGSAAEVCRELVLRGYTIATPIPEVP